VRSDLAIKLFGDDLEVLKKKAVVIKERLEGIRGAAEVNVDQVTGQPVLRIQVKQDEIATYGVPAKAVLDLVESIGSKPLGEVVEGPFRFPLVVRLPERFRAKPKDIGKILLTTSSGDQIPLARLADIQEVEGPSTITREWGQRRIVVTCNIVGRDMGSFVAEAQRAINADSLKLPSRYHLQWGGQFENYERASKRLLLIVPLVVMLIFGLLYLTYQNVIDALRVFTGVPLGWAGGVLALWFRGMPFSISAAVGFIAMSGVAVLDDMILVSYIRQLRRKGLPVNQAVSQAALTRLRPVLMTTLVASLGFLPMAFSTGIGAEVQRPLATVVIGGVISAMVMSLLVGRVLYVLFDRAAQTVQWLLLGVTGLRAEQLSWLFGEHGIEANNGDHDSRNGSAANLPQFPEQVHA
jgi:heavy metal efflux system protein